MILENSLGNVTHLPPCLPHQLCFSLCPGLTAAMKTPHSHFYSGRLSVFQTLNSAREKFGLNIKVKVKNICEVYKKRAKVLGSLFFD